MVTEDLIRDNVLSFFVLRRDVYDAAKRTVG